MSHRRVVWGSAGSGPWAWLLYANGTSLVSNVPVTASETISVADSLIGGYGSVQTNATLPAGVEGTWVWAGSINNTAPGTWTAIRGYGCWGNIRYTSLRNRVQFGVPGGIAKELTSSAGLTDGTAVHVFQLREDGYVNYARPTASTIAWLEWIKHDNAPVALPDDQPSAYLYAGYGTPLTFAAVAPTLVFDEEIMALAGARGL